MKEDIEKIAVVGGAVATIALVVLTLKNKSAGNTGVQSAQNLPVVLRSVTPETVALRAQKTQTDLAEIGAKVDIFKTMANYNLGIDTNRTGLELGLRVSDNNLAGVKYSSDNEVKISDKTNETNRFVAERVTYAQTEAARYAYEAEHQKQKSARTKSVSDTIGSVVKGFLSFL